MIEDELAGVGPGVKRAKKRLLDMLDKSVDVIEEILDGQTLDVNNQNATRFKAATFNLGVFDISPTKKSEVVSKDGDLPEKALLLEQLREEMRRQVEAGRSESGAITLVAEGTEVREVQGEPLRSLPGGVGVSGCGGSASGVRDDFKGQEADEVDFDPSWPSEVELCDQRVQHPEVVKKP